MSDNDTAIKAENVSKVYRIGTEQQRHENIASALVDFIRSPLRNYQKYRSLYDFRDLEGNEAAQRMVNSRDTLWALRGLSFEVKRGEILGFIGTNGAGKSTLLKILARITPPTRGRIEIHGRVSSLLEVGTGFHPELTGRDNVYLNGTILGMRKKEVDRKFDEIVEFSGVERFLDTPVKRYSSGMRVRLAFAVAAHLEPEILIIDEVLAVGDAAFQRKCMNKMQDVGAQGRTVLFVSHNMATITRLCQRAVLLNEGVLQKEGSAHEVVGAYLNAGFGTTAKREWVNPDSAPGGKVARLRSVRICDAEGKTVDAVEITRRFSVEFEYDVLTPDSVLMPHFDVFNDEGVNIFVSLDQDAAWRGRPRPVGRYMSKAWIPGNLLAEGTFFVSPAMLTRDPDIAQFYARDAIAFQVFDVGNINSARGDYAKKLDGVIRPLLEWETHTDV